MADVRTAVEFVMRQEDARLLGVVTDAPADRGGKTRFGITSKWHPDLVAAGFFEADRAAALLMAASVYEKQYSGVLHLAELNSEAVAIALLSFAVVAGSSTAVEMMQHVLNDLGASLTVDGEIGAATVAAENSQNSLALVQALVVYQAQFFHRMVCHDPSQLVWAQGWSNRSNAVGAYARAHA